MPGYIDQLNRKIELPHSPMRIISLVPSQTELLADLGLGERVIGITKYCIYPPEWFLSKPHVGGTKNFSIEKIKTLSPDLVIANKEENTAPLIAELESTLPVWVSDIRNLDDSLEMILEIGKITGTLEKAEQIVSSIVMEFQALEQSKRPAGKKINTAYFIWRKPYMTAGNDTFINDMLNRCGLKNVFNGKTRYPEVSIAEIREARPKIILLSSEPFPFRDKHIDEFKSICPSAKIITVNGEFFSWYGSRIKMAPSYFRSLSEQLNFIN